MRRMRLFHTSNTKQCPTLSVDGKSVRNSAKLCHVDASVSLYHVRRSASAFRGLLGLSQNSRSALSDMTRTARSAVVPRDRPTPQGSISQFAMLSISAIANCDAQLPSLPHPGGRVRGVVRDVLQELLPRVVAEWRVAGDALQVREQLARRAVRLS